MIYKIKCTRINKNAAHVDIGANKSADGQNEDDGDDVNDPQQETVIDLIDSSRLKETSLDKATYKTFLKEYLAAIKEKLQESDPDRVAPFMAGAKNFMSKILTDSRFPDSYSFYLGESEDIQGMIILLEYLEDESMFAYFWKDGLYSRKY